MEEEIKNYFDEIYNKYDFEGILYLKKLLTIENKIIRKKNNYNKYKPYYKKNSEKLNIILKCEYCNTEFKKYYLYAHNKTDKHIHNKKKQDNITNL